ncbi:MAG: sigma-70 family RNA polymerase sigma factor [Bacteroidetes bacterium]|nr:sigma-70 family RNA polymerase sigma factor [Bacteroidota bacterium]
MFRKTSDNHLWTDFISGDEEAFRRLYEIYIQDLFKYGCHFSTDEELIKDCIHDLFIDLHHYRSKLKKTDNIKAYLFVSLRRIIIKKNRQEEKRKPLDINGLPFKYSLCIDDNAEELKDEQRLKFLESAMKELSARQREAIYLKFVSGLSYEELSKVLQISYQASRNLIYRGMERLRDSISAKTL